ncbi:MAG: tRNA (adenosine(37)-N6)-threonylcarbamoyltransferase complex transferase subunit TsaD [Candidatus Poribacteria bacterium]|nr:tRNA (adenosine(37)-N6)-threonylcarbamoyltransferase complex transferase subunit TsaD [Candidatus Poribacteria bacterium]MDE0506743.1 tRNA (adenosine(37)-N6)-threonylcarbamoyltransferase complex transferase subunit TsaD [Candidatus Poribacteria bacterium]
MNILGIDTSCDETAAAVVVDGREILSNIISSQIDLHRKYGGIVPELASRKHVESINYIVDQAMLESGTGFEDLRAIAVTNRPGLIGALLVGVAAAKSLAYAHNLPLLGINHIEGHIYANFMVHDALPFPHVCLTVSGGHTLLVEVQKEWRYEVLGGTLDDAAGEAYDKVAQYLGLGFPGGKVIDDLAKQGNPAAIEFPRPMLDSGDYQFSFSGIKTAVRYYVDNAKSSGAMPPIEDIAASFQAAVVDVLVRKTIRAAQEKNARAITLTGGVAANSQLRASMSGAADSLGAKVYYPPINLCTDNGAMIAGIAYHQYQTGQRDALDLNASASGSILEQQERNAS